MLKLFKFTLLLFSFLFVQTQPQTCGRQRCCLSSTCTQSYCTQKNSQTWISVQNFANYQYTKLVMINNQCKPCPYDCRSCSSQTTCDTCAKGFYKDNTTAKCQLCGDRCTSCTVVNLISKCGACEDGTYLQSVSQTCKSCPQGAKTCSSPTAIIDCNAGYKKSSNSLYCTPCPSNCISCPVSDSICASCSTGYYLNNSMCFKCTIKNCSACLRATTTTTACTTCASGFLLSSGACISCPINCRTCSSQFICTVCNSGYFAQSGSCLKVSTNITSCLTYNSSTSCSVCNSGYYMNNTLCYPCSLLCATCDGSHFGRCLSCNSNANLFNKMCLVTNFPSISTYNLYYSFPGSFSLIRLGSSACGGQYISGREITINLDNLRAYKLEISWKVYSMSGSSTYSVTMNNTGGTNTLNFTTSSLRYSGVCSDNMSVFYNMGIETKQVFSSIKKLNTLTFSTDNGVSLMLHELVITAYRCNQLCIQCSQTLCTQCLMTKLYTQDAYCVYSCSNNYYIYQNSNSTTNPKQCLSQCPLGSYTMTSNVSCVLCTSPCMTCLNEQFCLSCVDGFYLTKDNTCNQTCPYRYYEKSETKTCEKCVGRCLECKSEQKCVSCRVGFFYNTTQTCVDSCGKNVTTVDGLYASLSTLNCEQCNTTCMNCLYSSTECTQCVSTKYLYDSTCLSSCPTGYFAPNVSNICQSCSYPCKTCQLTSTNCTACLQGYLYNNQCINDCPSGYYQDNVNLQCKACDSNCIDCYGTSSYCLSCKNTSYYYQYGCYNACPTGYYPQNGSNVCTNCVNLCLTCTTETNCSSCRSNFLYLGECVSSGKCPSGYFADMATLSCQKCFDTCMECQYNSTYCTKCNISDPTGLIYLQKSKCVSNCSTTYYYPKKNSTIATCQPCEQPCLTCTTSTSCLSCISGYKYSNNICSSTCSIGTFFDSSINDCVNCSANCDVCSSATFCQKCTTNYSINFNSSNSSQCVKQCPSTYYGETLSSSCQKCIFPCDTCSSSIDCLTCLSGVIYSSRCISSCPDSTFLDTTTKQCIQCQGNCLTCSGQPTYCQSCKDKFFLFYGNHTCLATCPVNYFAQNTTKSCLECPSTCNSCLNSTYCVTCIANKTYMNTITNICVEYCPVGYFGNLTSLTCEKCADKCLNCQSTPSNCISCKPNYFFIKLTFDTNDCQLSCPGGYYAESSYCYECNFPCKTCSSSSKCITCIQGTFYHANSSYCLLNCPTQTFYNYFELTCQPCKYPCSSCDGSQTACLSCANTTNNSTLFLFNGSCVSNCPTGYYPDDTGVCNKCYGLCKTCNSKYYCLTCIVGYIYVGFCYSTCPLGTYANTTINSCQPCSLPCSQCVIKSTYCTKCSNSMFVYKGNCSTSCPTGTYQNNGECLSCDFPCVQCNNSKTCTRCLGGYLLYMNLSCISDVSICPNDFYKMDSKQCVPGTWCPDSYFKDQTLKTCSGSCDRKKYTNLKTGKCEDSCSEGWYAGPSLVCQQWKTNPAISLMTMSTIAYISSSYMYVEVIFNESMTWIDVATDMYSFFLVESRRLQENGNGNSSASGSQRLLTSSYNIPLYLTTLQAPTVLKLRPSNYPQRIELKLPAYRLKSTLTNYPLQNPSTTISLPSFTAYSNDEIYSGMIVGQFSEGISWFILLLSFFFLFKNRLSDLYVLWDTVQLLYLLIFLDIQYPPNVNQFFKGLKFTHFTFLPSIFTAPTSRKISSSPFYAYSTDNSFLRNTGGLSLALIVVFVILVLLKIAQVLIRKVKSIKDKMVDYPGIKEFVYKGVLRYRWHHVSDVMFLTYLYMVLFAFSEIYYISENANHLFSNILAILMSVIYVFWVGFVGYKLHRHFKNISKGKMVNNLKCFYRGIQKENKFGVALVLIRYARKLFYALIISIFSTNPMFALPLLMFSSVLMSLFLFINLPYKKKLSNLITLGAQMILVIMYILLALINFNNEYFSASIKHTIGWVVCLLLAGMIFGLIYEVFCKTMFYLQPQVGPSKLPMDEKEERMVNDKEREYLRKKAEEFFDSLLPRLRERLNLDEDSDDELYKNYESGDSENSENNQQRERQWNDSQSHNSEEFKHYDNSENSQQPTSLNSKMKIQQAPHYLVRCVKEIQ